MQYTRAIRPSQPPSPAHRCRVRGRSAPYPYIRSARLSWPRQSGRCSNIDYYSGRRAGVRMIAEGDLVMVEVQGDARLRLDFGDPLLIRSARAMRRTPRGDAPRDTIETFLDRAAALYRPEAFIPGEAERVFRAAMPDVVATTLLPPLIEILATEAPRCRLEIIGWPGLRRHAGARSTSPFRPSHRFFTAFVCAAYIRTATC
jgi:hypothetical protein